MLAPVDPRVRRMEGFIATRLHKRGIHGADILNAKHLLALAYLSVFEATGMTRLTVLDPVIRDATERMWLGIEAVRTHAEPARLAA